jgi:hypothetical protein
MRRESGLRKHRADSIRAQKTMPRSNKKVFYLWIVMDSEICSLVVIGYRGGMQLWGGAEQKVPSFF